MARSCEGHFLDGMSKVVGHVREHHLMVPVMVSVTGTASSDARFRVARGVFAERVARRLESDLQEPRFYDSRRSSGKQLDGVEKRSMFKPRLLGGQFVERGTLEIGSSL